MSRYSTVDIQKQFTRDSIKSEGIPIALLRRATPVGDGAGGYAEPSEAYTVMPAKKRILVATAINVRSGNTREYFQDSSGERYLVKYVMIGNSNDDIDMGDFFMYQTQLMKIADIHPDRSYEVRAQIIAWSMGI